MPLPKEHRHRELREPELQEFQVTFLFPPSKRMTRARLQKLLEQLVDGTLSGSIIIAEAKRN